jgi:hypothetical protein
MLTFAFGRAVHSAVVREIVQTGLAIHEIFAEEKKIRVVECALPSFLKNVRGCLSWRALLGRCMPIGE